MTVGASDPTTEAPLANPSEQPANPLPTFTILGAPDAVACEGDACLLPVR